MSKITLSKIVRSVVLENKKQTKISIVRDIQQAAKNLLGNDVFKDYKSAKHGEIRIQPVDFNLELSHDQIVDILAAAGHPLDTEINPDEPNSKSGRYKTYLTSTGHYIVFAALGNEGLRREITLTQEIQSIIDGEIPSEYLLELFEKLAINYKDIATVKRASAQRVRRPLTDKPIDVGKIISDITIGLHDGTQIYISFKLKKSGSLSLINLGYTGAFTVDYTGAFSENTKNGTVKHNNHKFDFLLSAVGLSKDKIAFGLQSILQGDPQNDIVDNAPIYNENALRDYMSSAYGYGYWYVTESKTGWKIVDLTTYDKLADYIGEFHIEQLIYPGKSRNKRFAANSRAIAKVVSSENRRYSIVIRNTEGKGIIPSKILIDIS